MREACQALSNDHATQIDLNFSCELVVRGNEFANDGLGGLHICTLVNTAKASFSKRLMHTKPFVQYFWHLELFVFVNDLKCWAFILVNDTLLVPHNIASLIHLLHFHLLS